MDRAHWFLGACIGLGLGFGGWFIGAGISSFSANDRHVSVKGLAEQEVMADRAVWPITFIAASNDFAEARKNLASARSATLSFLETHKIGVTDVELQGLRIQDQLAKTYTSQNVALRYLLQQTVLVRTDNVLAVAGAAQNIGDLLDKGVLLGNIDGYEAANSPQYLYTKLNDIKPAMIGLATANARSAAQKFADDAGTSIEGILTAYQGRFEILPADSAAGLSEATQIHKKVRVVTTLDYVLGQ